MIYQYRNLVGVSKPYSDVGTGTAVNIAILP